MRVPKNVYLFLVIGLLAASQSANIIRLGQASAVAIATWRLGLAAILLFPLALPALNSLKKLDRLNVVLLILSGMTLAFHFFAWIAAVQHTTVVNASVFFSINPVITGAAAYYFFGERPSARLFISIGLGLAGVVVLGWDDFHLRSENLLGDGLAVLCSFLFTAYLLLGKRLREALPSSGLRLRDLRCGRRGRVPVPPRPGPPRGPLQFHHLAVLSAHGFDSNHDRPYVNQSCGQIHPGGQNIGGDPVRAASGRGGGLLRLGGVGNLDDGSRLHSDFSIGSDSGAGSTTSESP